MGGVYLAVISWPNMWALFERKTRPGQPRKPRRPQVGRRLPLTVNLATPPNQMDMLNVGRSLAHIQLMFHGFVARVARLRHGWANLLQEGYMQPKDNGCNLPERFGRPIQVKQTQPGYGRLPKPLRGTQHKHNIGNRYTAVDGEPSTTARFPNAFVGCVGRQT